MNPSPRSIRRLAFALALLLVTAAACTTTSSDDTSGSPPMAPDTFDLETATSSTAAVEQTSPGGGAAEPSPATSADAVRLAAGDHRFLLAHDGRDRSYRVHVPDVIEPAPAVLVALHGGGGTGEQFQDDNGMDAVADREGFIVLYPEGTGVLPDRLHTWNSGFNCCGYSLDNDVDDVGFLRAVIDDIATRARLDRGRVYMTGHSNGAMMSYRFAAEAGDVVTAIVPVAGALSVMDPTPAQPVSLLHIHSIDDPRAQYAGGEGPPFPGTTRTHVAEPVLAGIETWAAVSGCDAGSTVVESIDGPGDEHVDRLTWTCPDDVAVEHLRLAGSGHGWPGVEVGPVVQRLLGPPTRMVDASEAIWAFVSQFDRTP